MLPIQNKQEYFTVLSTVSNLIHYLWFNYIKPLFLIGSSTYLYLVVYFSMFYVVYFFLTHKTFNRLYYMSNTTGVL